MPETTLESIRRQMRESEGRLKKAIEDGAGNSRASSVTVPSLPESQDELADSSNEWAAYGQMTPGLLNEICLLLAEEVQGALEKSQPESEWAPVVRAAETARSLLSRWIESAECLSSPVAASSYPELLQKMLSARRAELLRWGINVELEDASEEMEPFGCPLDLFRVVMHMLQYCIEQLQGSLGISNLLVYVQNPGGRVETTFAWTPADTDTAPPGRNVELLAAQKLLNRLGGKLVLENIGEKQRAVRMAFAIEPRK